MPMKPVVFPAAVSRLLIVVTAAVAWATVSSLGTVDAVAQDADKNKKAEKKDGKKEGKKEERRYR